MTKEQREKLIQKTAAAIRAINDLEKTVSETNADVSCYYVRQAVQDWTPILVSAVDGGEIPERKTS